MEEKPQVVVMSKDGDDIFTWFAEGWDEETSPWLYARARVAIDAAADVSEAVGNLEAAGFTVYR